MIWSLLLVALVVAPLAAVLVLAFLALQPAGISQLRSNPRPTADYDEALQRILGIHAQERNGYDARCLTQLLTHGSKTCRAVVLVHGYTNCPQQFVPLGRHLCDRGDNVLIARLPRHGCADRLTDEHGGLVAEELARYADQVVDIARGLGEQVVMAGLSGGAIVTAWAAQNRSDLDRAVMIAPTFGFKSVPAAITVPLMNAVLLLPDVFRWWEPELREKSCLPYAYPRYSQHALAQILRLAFATRARGRRRPPAARSIVVVTNACDPLADNAAAVRMTQAWRAVGARDVRHYEFPAELELLHDLIDPNAPHARTDVVYPKLVELMEAG